METQKILVPDNNLKTTFESLGEVRNYMTILGAESSEDDRNTFYLDGMKFYIDNDPYGVYIENDIPKIISDNFEKYGMDDSIYQGTIQDLEGLVLLRMSLCNEDIDNNFENVLYQAKKEMLETILAKRKPLYYEGVFSCFDRAVAPFLSYNFNIDNFLERCVFNTTGYYAKNGYANCIHFSWKEKTEPDIHYDIGIGGYGIVSQMWYREKYDRFHQSLFHRYNKDEDTICYGQAGGTKTTIKNYSKIKLIKEIKASYPYSDKRSVQLSFATKSTVSRILDIVNAFTYKVPTFDRESQKIKE